jgi:hypothetical protein
MTFLVRQSDGSQIQIINHSNKFKIKNQLESTKNKKDDKSKSGIYKITRRCGFKYIGWARKAIQTQFTEHLGAFKHNYPIQSAVADHMLMKDGKKRGYKLKFDIQHFKNFYDQSTTTENLIFTNHTISILMHQRVCTLFDESGLRTT